MTATGGTQLGGSLLQPRPWQWRDRFPKVNVPTTEERCIAQENVAHLLRRDT
jgi:hypothetical protein